MIHRIEPGWMQVNDVLSKQEQRQRRRLRKHRGTEAEEEEKLRPGDEKEEKSNLDLVA